VSFNYFVAGLCVKSQSEIPGLSRDGNADSEVDVVLVDHHDTDLYSSELTEWIALPVQLALPVWCKSNGKELHILPNQDVCNTAAVVRQSVPFASALQGCVILHASAIEASNAGIVFIGAGGVGKSTIGAFLSAKGYRLLVDDLLPCRLSPEGKPRIFITDNNDSDEKLLRFKYLFFLERSLEFESVKLSGLTKIQTLQRLVQHGFGEVENRNIWKTQFDMYHLLATTVPSFDMGVPDDKAIISGIVNQIESKIVQGLP